MHPSSPVSVSDGQTMQFIGLNAERPATLSDPPILNTKISIRERRGRYGSHVEGKEWKCRKTGGWGVDGGSYI